MKKQMYATILSENHSMQLNNFQRKTEENDPKSNNRYSVKRLSSINNNDPNNQAKFSSNRSSKEERKFSSLKQQISNNIDQVYSNINLDLLVNSTNNLNSVNTNTINQSINSHNYRFKDNLAVNMNENAKNNKFNSSSSQQRSIPIQSKLNQINNTDYSINDLSFLNNLKPNKLSESTFNHKNSEMSNTLQNNALYSIKVTESAVIYSRKDSGFMNFNLIANSNNLMNNMNCSTSNNQVLNNKSIDISVIDPMRNFNSSSSQNSEQRKNIELLNSNLNNILNSQKVEDIFNPKTIKTQLRGTILV